MEHLLFATYLILFGWLVTRVKFFKHAGFTPAQLIILFLVKVMAGIIYGWIGVYYGNIGQMVDTWGFHYDALREKQLLIEDPLAFFSSALHNPYEHGFSGFLSSRNSWWNDVHSTLFIKVVAIFHLFSSGSYYINIIFYNFLTFFGPIAFYRMMAGIYPQKKYAVVAGCFFIPSFLFWTSGIHRDGIIFLAMALVIYYVHRGLKEKRFGWKKMIGIGGGLVLILLLRNFVILMLLPSVAAWLLAQRSRMNPWWVFSLVFGFMTVLVLASGQLDSKLNILEAIAQKQEHFMMLSGHSEIQINKLEPTAGSFIVNAPQAFRLAALRPYYSDVRHLLSLIALIEILALTAIFLISLFFLRKEKPLPAIAFLVFFSIGYLMMIGYTVNFVGAIVRYRSLFLPFLFVPVFCLISWNKLLSFLHIKNESIY